MYGLCKVKIYYDTGENNYTRSEYCALVPGNTFTDIVKRVEDYYDTELESVEVVGLWDEDLMCMPMKYFDTIKNILDSY